MVIKLFWLKRSGKNIQHELDWPYGDGERIVRLLMFHSKKPASKRVDQREEPRVECAGDYHLRTGALQELALRQTGLEIHTVLRSVRQG